MANLAAVKKGDLVYDPFIGTGSLLLPPSYYGAVCMGSDLDYRVLRGKGVGYNKKEKSEKANVFSNFDQFGFERPSIFRADVNVDSLRPRENVDAIICDPPYGMRAFSVKSGMSDERMEKHKMKMETKEKKTEGVTYAPISQCSTDSLFDSLLRLGSRVLRVGGKLVCLFPLENYEMEYLKLIVK